MLDDALFVERDEEPRLPTHTNAEEFRASFERAREASATARRERAYKFGQAQRARGVQLFGHPSSTVLRDAEAPPCTLSTDKPMDGGSDQFLETRIQRIRHSRTPYRKNLVAGE